jgi:hypothetical protein
MKRIGKYKIDFVIPLHKHNLLFPSVVEALVEYYTPSNIYIITSITEIEKLTPQISQWKTQKSHIQFIPEETFFEAKYSKKLETIKKWYTYRDEQSREFGWWYQQILKLGAVDRIPHLSSPFIIWDADLIPLEKWTLYPSFQIPHFHFALLQESEKNAFNQKQYRDSLFEIHQLPEIRPADRVSEIKSPSATDGTFVPHHFVFYPKIIRSFIKYLERIHHCTAETPWFRVILQLSEKYYRFSEYKIIATFMSYFYPRKLHYHTFIHYGKRGIRIRDSKEAQCFVQELKKTVPKIHPNQPHTPCPTYISYRDFSHFMYFKYEDTPSYIQVEHLVG